MWDLRDRDPVNRKYFKHAASITSLCFSPDDPHQFVVGLENGAIQRYDLRHQKNGRVWGAHGSKAVLDLQWKGQAMCRGRVGLLVLVLIGLCR
jgi:WD40 repeat protein